MPAIGCHIIRGVNIKDSYAFYYIGIYYMILGDRHGVKNVLEGNPIPTGQIRKGGHRRGLIHPAKDGVEWGTPKLDTGMENR